MKNIKLSLLAGIIVIVVALSIGPANAEVYKPNSTPPTDGLVGSNYTPAYAVNQVQFWHDFREDVVEKELAAARKYYGINTLRVYLHSINFEQEKDGFLSNLERFLKICDKHEIKPGFVFFDDCHRHEGIFLDEPTEPIKGYHNGRWAACPQDRDRDPDDLERFKPYVQEVIRRYRTDKRILFWEIFNEPLMNSNYSVALREAGYQWAKEILPVQPVLNCWDDSDVTDIVDAHNYSAKFGIGNVGWGRQTQLNMKKGSVFTEAGARWLAPRPSNGEPVEVIHWLQGRKAAGKYTPGVYLCWELMVGNSNCRWYWGTPHGTPEPTVPWCGLMWPDATPVSLAETEAIRRYTTGEKQAMFFNDFQDVASVARDQWDVFGGSDSGVLQLSPNMKMIAGDPKWTDYLMEAVVMLKEEHGNAGLVFRVNRPGQQTNEMLGYYVGFDTNKLYLGKMDNNWQPLAEYDLKKLDCKVVPGVWNQIRVEARGDRIKVWFNRMHPSSDSEKGLRIDIKDENSPVLSGNVGVRTSAVNAWFDNIIVLPVDHL